MDWLTESFGKRGFPFVEIDIDDIVGVKGEKGQDSLQNKITLRVKKGKLVIIDSIEAKAVRGTKSYVLLRELQLSKGRWNEIKLSESLARIRKVNFIESAEQPALYLLHSRSDTDFVFIEFKVKEKPSAVFDGMLGYEPKSNNIGLFGNASLLLRNLFGTGRELYFDWRGQEQRQEATLTYHEPWLFGFPLHIGFEGHVDLRDTLFSLLEVKLKARWQVNDLLTLSIKGDWQGVNPVGSQRVGQFTTSNILSGVEAVFDSRDRTMNTRSGTSLGRGNEVLVQKINVHGECFFRLADQLVLALGLSSALMFTEKFSYNQLIPFGGVKNLRGYRNDEFWVDKYVLGIVEFRLLISEKTNLFLFYNAAYFSTPFVLGYSLLGEYFRQGFGLGLTFEVGLSGLLGKISYAVGEFRSDIGETLLNGKLHVNMIIDF
ncbi:hypothetical protein CHS0354_000776 [Potamilus streckersoni]|uniref:Bacterial surface antigen (D15) domain-containing protein n=1 Tax=Potamilus streckersoni TaxID=2493646 RepID=A0AAE0T8F7_9BIVA|nr:hypothetical protein CHS0354_000776 [Potamilus streckersoni]